MAHQSSFIQNKYDRKINYNFPKQINSVLPEICKTIQGEKKLINMIKFAQYEKLGLEIILYQGWISGLKI